MLIEIINSFVCDVEEAKWMKNLLTILDNKNIAGAHKSDYIRYLLLYFFGGCWLDVSTFLIVSLDDLYQYNNDFICYYASVEFITSWHIKYLSDLYEKTPIEEQKTLKNITLKKRDMKKY